MGKTGQGQAQKQADEQDGGGVPQQSQQGQAEEQAAQHHSGGQRDDAQHNAPHHSGGVFLFDGRHGDGQHKADGAAQAGGHDQTGKQTQGRGGCHLLGDGIAAQVGSQQAADEQRRVKGQQFFQMGNGSGTVLYGGDAQGIDAHQGQSQIAHGGKAVVDFGSQPHFSPRHFVQQTQKCQNQHDGNENIHGSPFPQPVFFFCKEFRRASYHGKGRKTRWHFFLPHPSIHKKF